MISFRQLRKFVSGINNRVGSKMIKLLTSLLFFLFFAFQANAKTADGFFFKPYFSVEYSKPSLSGGVANSYASGGAGRQITHLENIAIGSNIRIHKYLGLNLNVAQANLNGSAKQNSIAQRVEYNFRQYNFSALGYAPIIDNLLELFGEVGISKIESKASFRGSDLSFSQSEGKATTAFYGIGLQLTPFFLSDNAFRVSIQKYQKKLPLTSAEYSSIRFGYLMEF